MQSFTDVDEQNKLISRQSVEFEIWIIILYFFNSILGQISPVSRGDVNECCHETLLFNSLGHFLILNWDKHWSCPRQIESKCAAKRKDEKDI